MRLLSSLLAGGRVWAVTRELPHSVLMPAQGTFHHKLRRHSFVIAAGSTCQQPIVWK